MLLKKTKIAIVIGCGRFGAGLAATLEKEGYDVTVMDKERHSFSLLPQSYSGYKVLADGADVNALEQAGICHADMVVAVTGQDCTNSLICQAASRVYHIPKVYMRLTDSEMERVIEGSKIQVIYPFCLSMREFEHLSGIEMEGKK